LPARLGVAHHQDGSRFGRKFRPPPVVSLATGNHALTAIFAAPRERMGAKIDQAAPAPVPDN